MKPQKQPGDSWSYHSCDAPSVTLTISNVSGFSEILYCRLPNAKIPSRIPGTHVVKTSGLEPMLREGIDKISGEMR